MMSNSFFGPSFASVSRSSSGPATRVKGVLRDQRRGIVQTPERGSHTEARARRLKTADSLPCPVQPAPPPVVDLPRMTAQPRCQMRVASAGHAAKSASPCYLPFLGRRTYQELLIVIIKWPPDTQSDNNHGITDTLVRFVIDWHHHRSIGQLVPYPDRIPLDE